MMTTYRRMMAAIAVLGVVLMSFANMVHAAESNPLEFDYDVTGFTRIIMVGATLGEDWAGFPTYLAADYVATGSLDRLNVTLPLHVSWITDTDVDNDAHVVDPPEPLENYAWFNHENFVLSATVTNLDDLYTSCAQGDFVEAPAGAHPYAPLTSDGELHVQDIHGGIGDDSFIAILGADDPLEPTTLILVVVGWNRPDTHFDDYTVGDVNVAPGDIVRRRVVWLEDVDMFYDQRIVEWVSTDAAEASRRVVDAADLSAFSAEWTSSTVPVRWGWDTVESPSDSRNFHVNFSMFSGSASQLDWIDLAHLYADLEKTCGLSKTDEEDPDTIFAWFGYEKTNETVVYGPNGETGPMWVLADAEQRIQAIADPYGYRSQINSGSVIPWGTVKGLYR